MFWNSRKRVVKFSCESNYVYFFPYSDYLRRTKPHYTYKWNNKINKTIAKRKFKKKNWLTVKPFLTSVVTKLNQLEYTSDYYLFFWNWALSLYSTKMMLIFWLSLKISGYISYNQFIWYFTIRLGKQHCFKVNNIAVYWNTYRKHIFVVILAVKCKQRRMFNLNLKMWEKKPYFSHVFLRLVLILK